MRTLLRPPVWGLLVLALLLPWVSGCDQGSLNAPEVPNGLFRSYVAIGNSITAGFQSGGINQRTQQESYAVLLAEQMNTPFNVPTLRNPGCPPPLEKAFPPVTIAPDVDCALRRASMSSTINNVAVPNAAVIDVLTNLSPASNPNPLTSFILGGQSQIEAAKRANPTFVSAWIGNNDVLGAAIAGDTTLATTPSSFRSRYSDMVSELEATNSLQGAVFVGVADVTLIPHLSTGAAYNQAIPAGRDAGAVPPNFELASCGPADAGGVFVPFRHGAGLLGAASGLRDAFENIGASPPTITLDCSKDRTVAETIREGIPDQFGDVENTVLDGVPDDVKPVSLLTTQETAVLEDRVAAFNQIIEDQVAGEYGYVNPNPLFEANSDQIPAFPALFGDSSQPFGPFFSLDGIHPSAAAHRLVANAIIEEIKATYDVSDQELSAVSTDSQ
jgi:lysophospholipase L1-like esterase